MDFKLYNYLRLQGIPAEQATIIASDPHVSFDIDLYEQKAEIDNANRGSFVHTIGLKEEYKQVIIQH